MTEITLKNENGEYRVQVNEDNMTIDRLIQFAIEPVLLAAGYSKSLIDEYFHND